MGKHKHILIFTPGFARDEDDYLCIPPLQNFLVALQAARPDIQVSVLALHYPYRAKDYHWKGIPVYALGGDNVRNPLKKLQLWREVRRRFREIHREQPVDLIHCLWVQECTWLGQKLARRYGIRLLATLQGQDALGTNRYLKRIKPDGLEVVALSRPAGEELQRHFSVQPRIIPWGIPVADVLVDFPPERPIDVLGVGSFVKVKNWPLFLEVLRLLQAKGVMVRVVLIGYGPLRADLEAQSSFMQRGGPLVFAEAGQENSAQEDVAQMVSLEAGGENMTQEGVDQLVPLEAGKESMTQEGVEQLVPLEAGKESMSQEGIDQLLPSEGEEESRKQEGVEQLVPTEAGKEKEKQEGVEQLVPAEVGDMVSNAEIGQGELVGKSEGRAVLPACSIHFTGEISRDEVLRYMSQSKVLLHTADYEGQGYIFNEALAQGARIVSTPVGLAPEGAVRVVSQNEVLRESQIGSPQETHKDHPWKTHKDHPRKTQKETPWKTLKETFSESKAEIQPEQYPQDRASTRQEAALQNAWLLGKTAAELAAKVEQALKEPLLQAPVVPYTIEDTLNAYLEIYER